MSLNNPTTTAGDILIIDDTLDNLRFLSDLLTKAGYTVRKVTNGEMGLEAAQLEPPDLILLDIQMPGLLGYDVCVQLKDSDRTRHIPVIFLSARDEELDKVIAFESGGVDYITKPFQVVEVLVRIKTHLSISHLQQQLRLQNGQLSQAISQRAIAETASNALKQELEEREVGSAAKTHKTSSEPQILETDGFDDTAQNAQQNKPIPHQMLALADTLHTSLAHIAIAVDFFQQRTDSLDPQEQQHIQLIADQVNRMSQALEEYTDLS